MRELGKKVAEGEKGAERKNKSEQKKREIKEGEGEERIVRERNRERR